MRITLRTEELLVYLLVFGWWSTISLAQGSYQVGSLPAINFNQGLPQDWALNFKWESRQVYRSGEWGEASTTDVRFPLSDLSALGARKVGLNARLVAGYLLRLREGRVVHRSIQQLAIIRKLPSLRVAHRFATDQTFAPHLLPEFRLRYRFTLEVPLNGQAVDPGEAYLRLNNEYLNTFSAGSHELELRLVPLLGYVFASTNKLEIGLDYRAADLLSEAISHRFWLSINWYLKR